MDQQVLVTEDNLTEFAEKFVQSGLGGGGGSSKNLEEFFEVTDSSTEILTTAEAIAIIEDCWINS